MKKKLKKKTAAPALTETLQLTKADKGVIVTIQQFAQKVEGLREEAEATSSFFQKAYRALSGVDPKKWDAVLTEAGIDKSKSYFYSIKRAAQNPDAADSRFAEGLSINKVLLALPTRSTKGAGAKRKTSKKKLEAQTNKALAFLFNNFNYEDIIKMVEEYNQAREEAQAEEEEEEEEEKE